MYILQQKMKIINVLKKWISGFSYTFDRDRVTGEAMEHFIQLVKDEEDEKMQNWGLFLQEQWTNVNSVVVDQGNYPISIGVDQLEFILEERDLKFIDIDPEEFARQICLYHQRLFKLITPRDIISYLSELKNKKNGIYPLSKFSKLTQNWVIAEIASGETTSERAKIINTYCRLILHLVDLGNIHGALDIYTGCAHFLVDRLKKTWRKVDHSKWKQISALMNPLHNHRELRNAFKEQEEPNLFPLVLLCKDMYQLNETQDNWENTSMINFEKRRSYSQKIISNISTSQRINYEFFTVNCIRMYFKRIEMVDEMELEKQYIILAELEKKKKKG
eukprot:TRINITY_DN3758_c0_g1_i2.p1 TRINITY_DN3758_c0_g1~~TRINITY_DN3758_c0_g1_i2.p1  ORF type:complete len:332 (-),score=76.96 TRINITY_DN3758_c0_g1_i2:78-1073(-)